MYPIIPDSVERQDIYVRFPFAIIDDIRSNELDSRLHENTSRRAVLWRNEIYGA